MTAFLHMPNISIPATKTNYICYTVTIPLPDPEKQYHVIQIDPYIVPENIDIVHHMLIHTCTMDVPANDFLVPKICHSPLGNGGCYGLLYGWAVGGSPLVLPPQAGYRIGANATDAIQYLVIEIHYSNPLSQTGRYDSSGVTIHFTENFRPNDAGSLIFGNIGINEVSIPANTPAYRVEASCPSECTKLWSQPINVFADFLHMHQAGSMIWNTLHRDGERIPGYINRVEYWDFAFQSYSFVERVLYPGDRINVVCVYNTTGKNTTKFGQASDDEMCLDFMAYYPRLYNNLGQNILNCGSARFRLQRFPNGTIINAQTPTSRNYSTVCWNDILWGQDNFTVVNPNIPDPIQPDSSRFFAVPCPQPEEKNEGTPKWVWIVVGVVGGLVLVSAMVFFCSRTTRPTDYRSIPGDDA